MYNSRLKKCINLALAIPDHKLHLVTSNKSLLAGCYAYLVHCEFKLYPELAEIFIREIEIRLAKTEEVEYEWTEQQWEAIQYIKTLNQKS